MQLSCFARLIHFKVVTQMSCRCVHALSSTISSGKNSGARGASGAAAAAMLAADDMEARRTTDERRLTIDVRRGCSRLPRRASSGFGLVVGFSDPVAGPPLGTRDRRRPEPVR